jgi:hypothetical protein
VGCCWGKGADPAKSVSLDREWKTWSNGWLTILVLGCVQVLAGCGGSTSTSTTGTSTSTTEELGLSISWTNSTMTNNTTPTLQVVVNPPLQPGQPLGAAAFSAVSALGPDYMRYAAWFPYPKLAVAELQPPTPQGTSWDFSLIDPIVQQYLTATEGHPALMSFSTIPQWMFVTSEPVTYPDDPTVEDWDYEQGTVLRDPTCQELAGYYTRMANWYVNGGFTDENGVLHESGYSYQFPVWEVFNEVDGEHDTTAEDYTMRYDAVVQGVRSASPNTKFMGPALADPGDDLDFIQYFLNPANHQPGIPVDYLSYHFYAVPASGETVDDWQYTFFEQADWFLGVVQSIETIRKNLSPQTKTDIDELGTILPTDNTAADNIPPPPAYWNVSGAMYAYLYVELARRQIDIVGESQLVGFPSQFPSVSMMDWVTYQPDARYWILKLIKDNFHPGDTMVETALSDTSGGSPDDMEAQAFITPTGNKLLLVNKRNAVIGVLLPNANSATALTVDLQSGEGPARSVSPANGILILQPFAVTVVSW